MEIVWKSGSSLTVVWPLTGNLTSLGLRKNEEVGFSQWFSDVASERPTTTTTEVALDPPLGLFPFSQELGVEREVEAQETVLLQLVGIFSL